MQILPIFDDFIVINSSLQSSIESIISYYNFIEKFPSDFSQDKYVNVFFNKEELPYNLKPRNYWQHYLSFRSIINFNSQLIWLETYPAILEEASNIYLLKNPHYIFQMGYYTQSIYETLPMLAKYYKHHDYVNNYLLTSNFYMNILSSNNENFLKGLFLCYYEPFGSAEITIQSYLSFNYEVNGYLLKNMFYLNKYFNLPVNSFSEKSQFIKFLYKDIKDVEFIQDNLNVLMLKILKK